MLKERIDKFTKNITKNSAATITLTPEELIEYKTLKLTKKYEYELIAHKDFTEINITLKKRVRKPIIPEIAPRKKAQRLDISLTPISDELIEKLDANIAKLGMTSRAEYLRLIIEVDFATGLLDILRRKK
jgi:hypothetical protein